MILLAFTIACPALPPSFASDAPAEIRLGKRAAPSPTAIRQRSAGGAILAARQSASLDRTRLARADA